MLIGEIRSTFNRCRLDKTRITTELCLKLEDSESVRCRARRSVASSSGLVRSVNLNGRGLFFSGVKYREAVIGYFDEGRVVPENRTRLVRSTD